MKSKRVVIKVGTSTLTGGAAALDRSRMLELVRVIAALWEMGHEVILVSSGAMAAGREVLNMPPGRYELSVKQMLASVGQGRLIELWAGLFEIYRLKIGQLLLTRADLENRERYLNARDALFALLSHGVVPVINENDAISTAEIKVGDNDNLAALTGVLAEADCVILLTDQSGLYTADPRKSSEAELIRRVDSIDQQILELAGGAGTAQGTGGMATKLQAARIATEAGVELVIASGEKPEQIALLIAGRGEGTFFTPAPHPTSARKSWIGRAARSQGRLLLDAGACRALTERGSSLLPGGISAVEGQFERGASVVLCNAQGRELGRGLCRYSAEQLKKIAGHRSTEIEEILGFSHGDEAVHRDDLVLTG